MPLWIVAPAAALNRASTSTAAIPLPQEDPVKKLLLAGLLATLGLAPALASAQTPPQSPQAEEKMLVGEVQSIDESGTQLTLKDGTTLLTPPGSMLRPGALEQGMVVVAMYREQENGDKILTRLSLGHGQSAPGTPTDAPKRY
jgi:hypothetical protein